MTKTERTISKTFKDFRTFLRMSQDDFGAFLRPNRPLSQKTISALERGQRSPSQEVLSLLLKRAKQSDFKLEITDLYDD